MIETYPNVTQNNMLKTKYKKTNKEFDQADFEYIGNPQKNSTFTVSSQTPLYRRHSVSCIQLNQLDIFPKL